MSIKSDKGFTLLEVLVVLLILSILASITVPALTGYIEESGSKACAAEITALGRGVKAALALNKNISDDKLAEKIVEDYGGVYLGAGCYRDLCPSGGIYTIEIDENWQYSIECGTHNNSEQTSAQVLSANIQVLMNNARLKEYFSNRLKGAVLDSTGVVWGAGIKDTIKKDLGLGNSNFDFVVYRPSGSNSNYQIYIFDSVMGTDPDAIRAAKAAGTPLTYKATKYVWDPVKQEVTLTIKGTAEIYVKEQSDNGTYISLDYTTFVPE